MLLFISYSTQNKAIVERLRADLRDKDLEIWFDSDMLTPGTMSWRQSLRQAITAADAVVLCASPHAANSRYVEIEVALALAQRKPIYPAWIAGEEWTSSAPVDLIGAQHADLRGDQYESGLSALVSALKEETTDVTVLPIQSNTPDLPPVPEGFEPRNPYKGLRAFRADDAGDFFGRDALIAELVAALDFEPDQPRFLAVVGASGSGKSSVVMAGLLPALATGALPGSGEWRSLKPMVPGVHPLENLTIALSDLFPQKSQTAIREDLDNRNARGLHMLAKAAAGQSRLLLYIDQFEELFTLTSNEAERRHFIDLLTTAVSENDGSLVVVLSLRADFYDRPLEYGALGNLLKAQTVTVLPMELNDLIDVVTKPAAQPDVRLNFDEGLVTEMVFAVREEIGALPLLQFTLDQLFKERDGQRLTHDAYNAIGGVQGALAQHAEATYQKLPSDEHRKLARALFLRLIEAGQTEQDTTRRRALNSELTLPDAEQTRILRATADAFVDARLLVMDTNITPPPSPLPAAHGSQSTPPPSPLPAAQS